MDSSYEPSDLSGGIRGSGCEALREAERGSFVGQIALCEVEISVQMIRSHAEAVYASGNPLRSKWTKSL